MNPWNHGIRTRDDFDFLAVPRLAALSVETRRRLGGISHLRRYDTGQVVADAGEQLNYIGCVQRGILRMQKISQNGRQQIVGLLVEGDIFGRVFEEQSTVTIEAATAAEVIAFRRTPFEALLLGSPELERLVLLNLLNELDRSRDWLIILANPRIRGRLAGFLTVLCTRFPPIGQLLNADQRMFEIKIPISRSDLAHLLGTSPESISRAFHALADDGIIAIKRPDLVQVRNSERLVSEAGEDGADLHASLRALLLAVATKNDRWPAKR